MRKMLETWGDAQVVIRLEFVSGTAIDGLVKEVDRDEAVIEPVYEDGSVGPLTVVNLNHVVMAFYDANPPDVGEASATDVAADEAGPHHVTEAEVAAAGGGEASLQV